MLVRHGQAPGHAAPLPEPRPREGLVNAFTAGDSIVLVSADGSMKRRPAKLSCFLKTEDATPDALRQLRGSRAVSGLADIGGWWRVDWRDYDYRKRGVQWLEKEIGCPTYEGDVSAVLSFLVEERPKIAQPIPVYLDIEADSRVPVGQHAQGAARVLCWVLVDEEQRTVARGMLEDDTDEAERDLLLALWRALAPFDQVRSWYGDGYDFPVIWARSKRLGIRVAHRRWLWLDHLEQFRRANNMAAESGEEKQSYALNAIAQAVVGEGKTEFDASKTYEAWAAGGAERAALLDYCEQDTRLMPKIEAETGYCELLGLVAETVGIFADSRAINPQTQVEALLLRLYHDEGLRPRTRDEDSPPARQFAGAYVMQPRGAGILRDVHVCDFAGMYPSIIRSFNISPETLLPPPINPNTGRPHYMPEVKWEPEKHIPAGAALAPYTNQLFDQGGEGVLCRAIAALQAERDRWNAIKKKLPPNSPEWKEADRRTTALKIAINSFYGVVGAWTSRFFSVACAESVTQIGRWLIEQVMAFAEQLGMQVVYGDTDSCFIAGAAVDEFKRFVARCNDELFPRLLAERGAARNFVKLDYEKQFSRLCFVSAKRYVGRYAHYKGTAPEPDAKPEIRGLEYKRGDTLRMARVMQLEAILLVSREDRDPTPEEGHELVERWKRRVLDGDLALEDVVQSRSLAKPLAGYKAKIKKDGTAAAQPPHVMVARELKKRGHDVREGSKIAFYCVDGAAKPKRFAPAEDWDGQVDRYELWESMVYPPTQRLLQSAFPAGGWKQHEKVRPAKVRAARAPKPTKASATQRAQEAAGQATLFAPLSAGK